LRALSSWCTRSLLCVFLIDGEDMFVGGFSELAGVALGFQTRFFIPKFSFSFGVGFFLLLFFCVYSTSFSTRRAQEWQITFAYSSLDHGRFFSERLPFLLSRK